MAIICRDRKLLFIMVPATGCSSIGEILIEHFGGEYLPEKDIYKNGQKILDRKHNSIKELVAFKLINLAELSIYLKFATVRNPFDRFTSEYQKAISSKQIETRIHWEKEKLPLHASLQEKAAIQVLKKQLRQRRERILAAGFETWLEFRIGAYKKVAYLNKIREELKLFIDPYHMPRVYSPLISGVDEIIRFEYLEEDFNKLLKSVGILRYNERITIPNVNPTVGKKPYQEYYSQKSRMLVEKHLARELAIFGYKFD